MSIGPIYGYTANYKFTLVEYDFPRWQSYEHDNWRNLDATLGTLFGTFGLGGIWKNGIVYNVNERIIDADENVLYLCLVDNTSIATGTFGQDRALNPANWRSLSFSPANRGNWTAGTQYNVQDIVISGSQIAICKLAHLSSTVFSDDINNGYWSVLIDVTGYNIGLSLTRNNNLSDLSNTITARSNLGLGSAAQNNTGDFFRVSNNLSEGSKVAIAATLGLKSGAFQDTSSYLVGTNNLSDLSNLGNARVNLGLGALATASSVTVSQISDAGSTGQAILKAGTPKDATATFNPFIGDGGSGGVKGLVPAPSAGDTAANKYLGAGGNWSAPNVSDLLGYVPVQQGGGPNQSANVKLNLGWNIPAVSLKVSVGGSDLGNVYGDYNCPFANDNPGYLILPSGFIMQWIHIGTDANGNYNWTFAKPISKLLNAHVTIDNVGQSSPLSTTTPPYISASGTTGLSVKSAPNIAVYISAIGRL